MIYSKHSTARRFTHTIWCFSWFSFHSFKAVVSTGQSEIRSMVHGSLFCNSNLFSGNISLYSLKWVLFGSAFQRLGWSLWALPGTGWFAPGIFRRLPALLQEQSFTSSSSGFYSKVIKFVGTCCLLLWQAALKCLNHSIAFILLPAWNLYEFPFSESVSRKRSGCSGSSAIITIHPTTETVLFDVDLKCFLSVAFRDLAA